ncbi:general secretion pathway protein GspB [Azohydromonas caseinilytica]|uniref:General secretion pathway protein GspB n=1 Tax=Azohydromonas caseinilytica TaxID=2728836 RepID=A0A848F8W7_9BURK|nr:general secretion pathway protein GspB [Azohydromonas caseinilytica]NML14783.1 general secretion pathway protein GspB [Azohydromonas caseinilytica]
MSYILQALQRAEAERARGATPGLNTPTLPGAAPVPRARRTLPWAVAAGTLAGSAVLAWFLWPVAPAAQGPAVALNTPPQATTRASEARTPAAAAPAVPAAPAAALTPAVPAVPIVAAPPAPAPAPQPEAAPAPRRAEAPPAVSSALPRAPAAAPSPAAPPPATAARPAPPAALDKPVPPATTAAATPAPAVPPVVTLAELPAPVRQALPPLNLGGGIYSPEPANRLLIVNGQVLRERAQIGPELVLESIGPKAAVFRFRQQRFEMRY